MCMYKSSHNLHLKCLTILLVNYISIKLKKKKTHFWTLLLITVSKLFVSCVLSSLFICVCTRVFSLWQNTHNKKFTVLLIFKHCDSVSLSIFTLLCNHPHHPSRELSHLPKLKTLCPWNWLSISCPTPGPHHLLPVSIDLTPPGTSYKWNQTISVLSKFIFFNSINFGHHDK